MKKLSIVIPCYNCSKTIGRLLDSVLANGLDKDEYEIIISDDHSTDRTWEIILKEIDNYRKTNGLHKIIILNQGGVWDEKCYTWKNRDHRSAEWVRCASHTAGIRK